MKSDTPTTLLQTKLSFSPDSADFWDSLPSGPGVYIFEDKKGEPLYIGKSIDLKTRFKQHFEGFKTQTTKASLFIPQTKTLTFVSVGNDIEAILLEANYIKTFKPRYNSIIKDDRTNLYLVLTNYPDTKILTVHGSDILDLHLDSFPHQVFGPFTSGIAVRTIVKQIRNIFGFCLSPLHPRRRSCFNFHLGHCPGVCNGTIDAISYKNHLSKIKRFLTGNFKGLHQTLTREIRKAIKNHHFEEATVIKNQIQSLEHLLASKNSSLLLKLSDINSLLQNKISSTLNHPQLSQTPRRIECYDLAHLQGKNYVGSMTVFTDGRADTAQYRHFHVDLPNQTDPHAMKQIISRRLKHKEWDYPELIILDGGIPQLSIVHPVIPKSIAVIALAKKRETIYFYDRNQKLITLNLPLEDPVLNLFRSIRDEAHRFANSFHRQQRQKTALS